MVPVPAPGGSHSCVGQGWRVRLSDTPAPQTRGDPPPPTPWPGLWTDTQGQSRCAGTGAPGAALPPREAAKATVHSRSQCRIHSDFYLKIVKYIFWNYVEIVVCPGRRD